MRPKKIFFKLSAQNYDMSSPKLVVLQKKICNFLKKKFMFDLRRESCNFGKKKLVRAQRWATWRKLNQSVSVLIPNQKALLSVLRYLNVSINATFTRPSEVLQSSKTFWNALLPRMCKDDRNANALWVWSNRGQPIPKLTRGFYATAKTPVASPRPPQLDDQTPKQGKNVPENRRTEEYGEIEEQTLYTEESSPVKLYSSIKRKNQDLEKLEAEVPPPQRCRLSCPLPPPEFFPPEKVEFLPNFQSPNLRFSAIPPTILPRTNGTEGRNQSFTMRTREQKVGSRSRSVPNTVDFNDFMPRHVQRKKNYLIVQPDKSQLYQNQGEGEPKMRALLFDPVSLALNCEAVAAPTKIFKDEVVVQVSYSGVCGSDLFLTEGKIPCGDSSIILGHEISGKVFAAGREVRHVKIGDNVAVDAYTSCSFCRYCTRGHLSACLHEGLNNSMGISRNGGWAEYVVVKKSQVHKVPEELGLDQAALVLPLSCVLSAMSRLNLTQGMKIFIQGLGLTGCLWASLLHARGYRDVLVTDKSGRKRLQFESLNLNYTFIPPEDVRKYMADVIVECTGSPTSIEKAFNILNAGGQMCFFGKPNPVTEVRCIPYDIIQKEITIFGNAGNGFRFSEAIDVAASLADRYLDLDRLGVQFFHLEDFKEAFQLKKSGEVSKIIFKVQT